ncbi:hypothetical protein VTH06DRAFT_5544 [Thermothelomyces fergusii]
MGSHVNISLSPIAPELKALIFETWEVNKPFLGRDVQPTCCTLLDGVEVSVDVDGWRPVAGNRSATPCFQAGGFVKGSKGVLERTMGTGNGLSLYYIHREFVSLSIRVFPSHC